jgi:AcrR family transcriptional regulator
MHDALLQVEGLRERKRRQTLQRIATVGLELFLAKGYEATTLDDITAAADISRRTFFYYFKSKDDILLAHLAGYAESLKASVLNNSSAGAPIDVAREALLTAATQFHSSQTLAIARLIQESAVLRTRTRAGSMQLEEALYAGLCELWPGKERRERMRLVAMVAISAMRFATDRWLEQDGKRPLPKHVRDAFQKLQEEI